MIVQIKFLNRSTTLYFTPDEICKELSLSKEEWQLLNRKEKLSKLQELFKNTHNIDLHERIY